MGGMPPIYDRALPEGPLKKENTLGEFLKIYLELMKD
jgi:hypothetical protein